MSDFVVEFALYFDAAVVAAVPYSVLKLILVAALFYSEFAQ